MEMEMVYPVHVAVYMHLLMPLKTLSVMFQESSVVLGL